MNGWMDSVMAQRRFQQEKGMSRLGLCPIAHLDPSQWQSPFVLKSKTLDD